MYSFFLIANIKNTNLYSISYLSFGYFKIKINNKHNINEKNTIDENTLECNNEDSNEILEYPRNIEEPIVLSLISKTPNIKFKKEKLKIQTKYINLEKEKIKQTRFQTTFQTKFQTKFQNSEDSTNSIEKPVIQSVVQPVVQPVVQKKEIELVPKKEDEVIKKNETIDYSLILSNVIFDLMNTSDIYKINLTIPSKNRTFYNVKFFKSSTEDLILEHGGLITHFRITINNNLCSLRSAVKDDDWILPSFWAKLIENKKNKQYILNTIKDNTKILSFSQKEFIQIDFYIPSNKIACIIKIKNNKLSSLKFFQFTDLRDSSSFLLQKNMICSIDVT